MRPLSISLALTLVACGGAAAPTGTGGQGGASTTSSSSSSSTSATSATSASSSGAGGGASSSTSSSTSASSSGQSSSTSASSSSSSGGDGGAPAGDCQSDADCPGGACVPVTPGGFRVCQTPPVKATTCGSPLDQCCAGQPCPNNEPCYAGPLVPLCGGIPMQPHNQCAVDQCAQDGDCASGQICGLAGTLGLAIRACIAASCKTDADCAGRAGGRCVPVNDPCCNVTAGLFCAYPNGGCRSNADCPSSQFCEVSNGEATCQTGVPLCPQ